MGIKLGLDFGTTTSILSFLDGSSLRTFPYGGYSGRNTPYVPSVVAYLPDDLLIGPDAVESFLPDAFYYRYFKMLLPEEDKSKWQDTYGPYATETLSPAEVTADFIAELITGHSPTRHRSHSYARNQSAFLAFKREEIEGLVVSVPQVWSHWRARGRQQLQGIVRKMGLNLKQLISEPVAAAAYFLHRYRLIQAEPFYGNLLICDMGGGTFDVTLCKLSENRVEVLCNAGNGQRGLGVAGAHFDHLLLSKKIDSTIEPRMMAQLLTALDTQKRSTMTAKKLRACLQQPDEIPITPIYSIAAVSVAGATGYNFTYGDIEEAFSPVQEGIVDVLTQIKSEALSKNYSIDKVVLVGGFSRFPLVQQAIAKCFGEDIFENRSVVDLNTLDSDEMAFAVSYGSCLVANNLVYISEKYDHTIGALTFNSAGTTDQEEIRLIAAGETLDALDDTVYCAWPSGEMRRFRFQRNSAEVNIMIHHEGSLAESHKISRRCALTDIPGIHISDNRWYLGARVDASKVPYLVIKDEKLGIEKEYPLGDLIPHAL